MASPATISVHDPDQLAIDGREYGVVSDVGLSFCLLVDGREMLPIGKYIIISYTRVTLAVDRSCIKEKDTCLWAGVSKN